MTQKYQYIQPVRKPASSPSRGRSLPSQAGVFVEGADRGQRDRHFAEHAHDQHHQQARDHEGEDRGRSRRFDDHAAADEKTRADDAAERDHRHVPLLQAVAQPAQGKGVLLTRG